MEKKKNLLFVDLVEDKIKSRGLFIVVSLLFYIYITYSLIVGISYGDDKPASIESSLEFMRLVQVGMNISEERSPQIKVTNKDGLVLENVNVTIQVIKIASDPTKKTSPICDSQYRENIKGSLDYIRFHEICKVRLEGQSELTDSKGNAYFKDFKIAQGPEAFYTVQYNASREGYDDVISEEFSFYVSSEINQLECMNTNPITNSATPFEPLEVQPIVKVKDRFGKPIKGKRVLAFSWVDAYFSDQLGYKNSPSNRKFQILDNFISEPSDSEGIAKFTNLTILGSSELLGYIHFYAEGITTVWTDRLISKTLNNVLPPRAFYPQPVDADEMSITILTDLHTKVEEGKTLEIPMSIQVLDTELMKPQKGVICFAHIAKDRSNTIPLGYRFNYPNHPVKHLERPIPGKYANEFENPSYTGNLIEEYHVTDEDGKVTFKDLRFSQAGPAGNYTLSFSCGMGSTVMTHPITVTSSISPLQSVYAPGMAQDCKILNSPLSCLNSRSSSFKGMKFRTDIPDEVYVKDFQLTEYDIVFIIEVLDKQEKPVEGKYPNKIYVETNLTSQAKDIEVLIQHELDIFEASLDDGIMTIPVKVVKLASTEVVANITLEIDGLNITTPYITFVNFRGANLKAFSKIEFTSVPSEQFDKGLIIGEKFELKAKAYDLKGDEFNLEDMNIYLGVYTRSASQAPVPTDFIKLGGQDESSIKKSGSEVTFKDLSFLRAGAGHYYLAVFAFAVPYGDIDFSYDDYFYVSEMVRVYVNQQIDIALLVSAEEMIDFSTKTVQNVHTGNARPLVKRALLRENLKSSNRGDEYFQVDMGKEYHLGFMIYNYKEGPLTDLTIPSPDIIFEEFPVLMSGEQYGPADYAKVKPLSSKTDQNGIYYVSFKIEYGGIGAYVISLDFGSCISISNAIITKNTLKSIKIETEPGFRDADATHYTGEIFEYKARVRIDVTDGPKSNYLIVAHPKSLSPNSTISLDILPQSDYELNADKENYIGWVSSLQRLRYAKTNSNGEATFEALTVWDITGDNATCQIYFAAGDHYEGLYVTTNATESNYTFIPSFKFEMDTEPNKFISAYQPIRPYPIIKVTSYVVRPFMAMTMHFSQIFQSYVKDSFLGDLTTKYMTGDLCFAILSETVDASFGCNITFLTSPNKVPMQFLVSMPDLAWSVYGIDTRLQMSFSSILQHNTTNAAYSELIDLENTAKTLTFIKDPPPQVSVNEIFQIKVKVTITGGAALPNAKVSCNVTKSIDYGSLATEIFTSLANANYNIQKSSLLAPKSSLDPARTSAKTDKKGEAKLYLRIKEAPLDSTVRLVCQSGKEVTAPSPKIKITHPIRRLEFAKNFTETIKVEFQKGSSSSNQQYLQTKVTLKKPITLNMYTTSNADIDLIRVEDINMGLVKYDEVMTIRTGANIDYNDIVESVNNITKIQSPFESLYDLGTTLVRGVQTVKTIKSNLKKSYKTEIISARIENMTVIIENATVYVNNPDKYMLTFDVNGVYTDILKQDSIIDIQNKTNLIEQVFDLYEFTVLVVFYLLILVFASKMIKGYFLVFGLLITAFFIYLIQYKKGTTLAYQILVYFFAGSIGLFLLWAFITYFIDVCVKKRAPGYYYVKKKKFYMEYVYQKLNGHPSNFWVNKTQKLGMSIKGHYNIHPDKDSENDRNLVLSGSSMDEESRKAPNNNITVSFEEFKAQASHSILSDYIPEPEEESNKLMYTNKELMNLPIDVVPYDGLGFFKKLIRIFTPFEVMYKKIWVTDAFVYPQVFLTCIVICFFSMAYLAYETIRFIFNFTRYIDDAYDQVYSSAYAFMRTGIDKYYVMFKIDPTYEELEPYYSKLHNVGKTVDQLVFAIKLGALIGATIATIAVMLNLLWLLYDYKRRMLDARKGVFNFKKKMISIQSSSGLPGGIISNSIFMFFMCILVLTIVFSIIAWPLTYEICWRLKWRLVGLFSATIVNMIVKMIMNKLCYGKDYIKRRTLLSIFDFSVLQLAIVAGIISAITRFGILTGVLFLSIMRIDVDSIPDWFSSIMYLDSFNKAYYGSILIQHSHNNPILITFYELLFAITKRINSNKDMDDEHKAMKNKHRMIRNRFHLWVFLHKNPSLREFRKPDMPQEGEGEGDEGDQEDPLTDEEAKFGEYSGDDLKSLQLDQNEEVKQTKRFSDEFQNGSDDEDEKREPREEFRIN